jgi:ankyrin repeat protein
MARCNRKRNRDGCNNVMILCTIGRNKPAEIRQKHTLCYKSLLRLGLHLSLSSPPPLPPLPPSPPPMPHSSRSHKAEAKFNVTTECEFHPSCAYLPLTHLLSKVPHLGLHAAAVTGNIGLAKYAISHGQPINSVIDGVLPLHAACSGGSDMVVRLLIDNGADVNAPRYLLGISDFLDPFFPTLEWLHCP